MALKKRGAISISDIAAEFGAPAPHKMSDFYRGGAYVPDTSANANVPTSGPIKASDFYGATAGFGFTLNRGGTTGGPTGYRDGEFGSLSPTTYEGATILRVETYDTGIGEWGWRVIMTGTHPKDFWSQMDTSVGTFTATAGTTTHSQSGGNTTWDNGLGQADSLFDTSGSEEILIIP